MHLSSALALRCFFLLVCASCAPSPCTPGDAATNVARSGGPAPSAAELDAYIRQAMRDWNVPGLAVAVVKDDSLWFAEGYGVRAAGRPEKVNTATLFGLMSPTKSFTTTALAMLVEEGRLSWDDPVIKHLPHFRLSDSLATREIRIRDLVSHRSGFRDSPRLWYKTDHDSKDLVRRMAALEPVAPLRSEFHYNNLMFVVAGEVIEAVSRVTWEGFVQERIFAPLEMDRSTTSVSALEQRDNVAFPHARRVLKRFGSIRPMPYFDGASVAPAGMIHSNVLEVATWLRMHLNDGRHEGEQIVSAHSVRELQRPHVTVPPDHSGPLCGTVRSESYGLGWFVQNYRGRSAVMHGGGIDGQRSAVGMLPGEGLGVVVLSNMHGTEIAQALLYRIFDMFLLEEPRDWSRAYRDQM